MAEKYGYGAYDSVEHEAYCMPSEQKRNTEQMNNAQGYHDMADLANTKPWPVQMGRERKNSQLGPEGASENYAYGNMHKKGK
ncbi:MAG TPA: hypothetical protein VNX68_19355 [Nitrosopumilaceae archaeon]|jgi:hypothetical protein|nr:hypothetical protein [Nitrosopumilaceae archaeon]